MPDSLPAISAILCGPDQRAYISRFDPDRMPLGIGPIWIRISPQGEQDEIVLPTGFIPLVATGGVMAGVYTDSTGLEQLAVTRLVE